MMQNIIIWAELVITGAVLVLGLIAVIWHRSTLDKHKNRDYN